MVGIPYTSVSTRRPQGRHVVERVEEVLVWVRCVVAPVQEFVHDSPHFPVWLVRFGVDSFVRVRWQDAHRVVVLYKGPACEDELVTFEYFENLLWKWNSSFCRFCKPSCH